MIDGCDTLDPKMKERSTILKASQINQKYYEDLTLSLSPNEFTLSDA